MTNNDSRVIPIIRLQDVRVEIANHEGENEYFCTFDAVNIAYTPSYTEPVEFWGARTSVRHPAVVEAFSVQNLHVLDYKHRPIQDEDGLYADIAWQLTEDEDVLNLLDLLINERSDV